MSTAKRIRRALLSVTDKNGLLDFAQALAGFGVELVSTGGTALVLREAGLAVKDISDLTGFPEMLDGRVKTLHPKVHGGLLYIRGNKEHEAAVAAHGIEPIDMVVVNLYAFEKTAAQPGVAFGHLIENIDIGGPSMVRSAAKNFEDVAIVTRVADYPALIEELKSTGGSLSRETRWRLAKQAFATTSAYDTAIANTLDQIADAPPADQALPKASAATQLPSTLRINLPLAQSLRYGENPHQRAALYSDSSGTGVAGATQLQGKELSFNNLVDLDACWELAQEFTEPAVVIVKHVSGGLLLQDADTARVTESELKVVTWRPPTAEELRSLLFAWRVAKHVKSNAIVYTRDGQTLGVGAGQMSRVDAARFGAMKAVLPLQGCVAASDAFFPFPDGLETVAQAGATAVIQPGGSVRDQDVIDAADKLGLAMVFTGIRHFRH